MSDSVNSVVSIAPVAAPGRVGAFAQPGSGNTGQQASSQTQSANNPTAPGVNSADIVTLQSLQIEHSQQTAQGKSTPQSASQAQAQAAIAAEAAAQAQAKAQAQEQANKQQQDSVQNAASTLSSYFSDVHPDVNFKVEQQSGGMVVVMVDSLNGKVLQTISGDEAKQLATSLFGKTSVLPQTA